MAPGRLNATLLQAMRYARVTLNTRSKRKYAGVSQFIFAIAWID